MSGTFSLERDGSAVVIMRTVGGKSRTWRMPIREGRVECHDCGDSGHRPKFCDGDARSICGRRDEHPAHEFVVACECRPMNRRFQARHRGATS